MNHTVLAEALFEKGLGFRPSGLWVDGLMCVFSVFYRTASLVRHAWSICPKQVSS